MRGLACSSSASAIGGAMQPRTGWPEKATSRRVRRAVCIAVAAAAMHVAASPATAASPTKGATYEYDPLDGGSTGAELTVSRSGRALAYVFLHMSGPCTNGRDGGGLIVWSSDSGDRPARLPIARDGSFSGMLASSLGVLNPFAV